MCPIDDRGHPDVPDGLDHYDAPTVPIVPLQAIIPTLAVAVLPSMLWAIVGVITPVVDIVTPEHAS